MMGVADDTLDSDRLSSRSVNFHCVVYKQLTTIMMNKSTALIASVVVAGLAGA